MLAVWFCNGLFLIVFLLLSSLFVMLGFQYNFPGKAVVFYAEQQFAAHTPFHLQIAPLEWKNPKNLTSKRVVVLAPTSDPFSHLFVLENFQLDFLPSFPWIEPRKLLEPNLHVQAQAYGGQILASINPFKRAHVELAIKKMTLDHIPALHSIPYFGVKGSFWLDGSVHNLHELQNGISILPKGKLAAKLENIKITPRNLEELIPGGLALPEMTFPEIHLELDYNHFLTIHHIQLTGAFEGTIEGKIFLNQHDLPASRVQLHLKLKMSEKTEEELGPIALIFRGFKCGDLLDFDLSGTLGRLNSPIKRACS